MRGMGDRSGVSAAIAACLAKRLPAVSVLAVSAVFLAACGTTHQPKSTKRTTKEYFAESKYGVKASPRVTNKRSNLPRGGGRDQLGKPYKVKGQWYRPKEEKNYRKVGSASWYGDAFHGRLTANGEVYDMTHLTAAHPTMPLPSYARVTNLANNSSVIVRVNDRGPFERGRIIDLSKRAAELLDYTHSGVAKVQVEYVGRAPLHGRDDSYLVASYRPGNARRERIDDGLPTGVMIAMNGRTPSAPVSRSAPPFPAEKPVMVASAAFPPPPRPVAASASSQPFDFARVEAALAAPAAVSVIADGDPILPDFGPVIPPRPVFGLAEGGRVAPGGLMSYADERVKRAAAAFDLVDGRGLSEAEIVTAWKRSRGAEIAPQPATEYIAAATFGSRLEAAALASALSAFGRASIEGEGDGYSVLLSPDGRNDIDSLVELAWSHGAPDALIVRE